MVDFPRNIDKATFNLSNKIAEQTFRRVEGLNEGTLKTFGHMLGSLAGSSKQQGKYEVSRGADYLMKEWQRFAGRGDKPATIANVYQFLAREFGAQAASTLFRSIPEIKGIAGQGAGSETNNQTNGSAETNAPTQQQASDNNPGTNSSGTDSSAKQNTNPQPNSQPKSQQRSYRSTSQIQREDGVGYNQAVAIQNAEKAKAQGMKQAQPTPAQNTTQNTTPMPTSTRNPGQLTSDLYNIGQSKEPSRKDFMIKVYQLLKATSGDRAGRANAIKNLKSFQDSLGDKIPELKQIDLSKFTESEILQIFGLTSYLIENRISSKTKFNEVFDRFFPTNPVEIYPELKSLINESQNLSRLLKNIEESNQYAARLVRLNLEGLVTESVVLNELDTPPPSSPSLTANPSDRNPISNPDQNGIKPLVGQALTSAASLKATIQKITTDFKNKKPVQNFDNQAQQLKSDLSKKFPNLAPQFAKYCDFAKTHPTIQVATIGLLTAAAAFAAGPIGVTAVAGLLRSFYGILKTNLNGEEQDQSKVAPKDRIIQPKQLQSIFSQAAVYAIDNGLMDVDNAKTRINNIKSTLSGRPRK